MIQTIVITGGPCGGKSSAMAKIREVYEKKGYTVLFIHETATELITSGLSPSACHTTADYQLCQMKMQLAKEEIYRHAAQHAVKGEKILVVCDRGLLDNRAYMTQTEFDSILALLGITEKEMLDRYDGVFHLVTAAKGAAAFYTVANNAARSETPKEAAALDDILIRVWSGHKNHVVIENLGGFDQKLADLLTAIDRVLAPV